jgi:2-phosphosulfolactate phosphatase
MVEFAVVRALRQHGSDVRFDWGPTAAEALVEEGGALVVVDTLSFTTAVSVATGRGTAVYPWPLGSDGARQRAAVLDAALAVPRGQLSPAHPWSLSPRSLLDAPFVERLVLPSPNGSAIASVFAGAHARQSTPANGDVAVVAACLRNATSTVRWLVENGYGSRRRPVAVVAAGERWPDGSLRPALEDVLGGGAVVARLVDGGMRPSVEARAAAALFEDVREGGDLEETLAECASGLELAEVGFGAEIEIAAALDADDHASVLSEGAFVRA